MDRKTLFFVSLLSLGILGACHRQPSYLPFVPAPAMEHDQSEFSRSLARDDFRRLRWDLYRFLQYNEVLLPQERVRIEALQKKIAGFHIDDPDLSSEVADAQEELDSIVQEHKLLFWDSWI